LHDTETDGTVFNFDGTSSWLEVYAKGDVDCYSYSISVTDDMFEYFYPNCDAGTEITGYTYLGDVEIYDAGTYNIDAEGNVVIVDADGLIGPVFAMCGGGVCCLLGLILLIVGLSTGKKVPQVIVYQQPDGTMYQPNQTTVHQYIPPSGEPSQQQFVEQPQVQEQQNIPPAFEERPNDVPVYQTDFDGFSFEHKKDD
ncbi:MAG: hypothetical protein VX998_07280, partial [Candidatus Thermoplasmatota archaeon]|nr:hypothetical protein [Candidatus Thermoplasmatota archaeon]